MTQAIQTARHSFSWETHKCTKCGMTEEFFEDNEKPPCRGGRTMRVRTQRTGMPDAQKTVDYFKRHFHSIH